MGKDSRGIDRGKSPDEYQEFERETGVSCSYCGSPLTRHVKLKGTQSSQTSQMNEAMHENTEAKNEGQINGKTKA